MEIKELITVILEVIIGLSVLIGGITFIIKWCFNVDKKLVLIEQKLEGLPNIIKADMLNILAPSAFGKISSQDNPLSEEEKILRNRLLKKLQFHTITKEEAIELRKLLEIEKDEAEEKAKWDLLLALGIALATIAVFLSITKD